MTSEHQAAEVEFHDAGQGVFWLAIRQQQGSNTLTPALIGALLQALRTLREAASLKVLVLKGLPQCFLQGGRESVDAAVQHKLVQAITTFPSPVIAAMQGDALGAGFLLAALCDTMVCSRQARYGFTSAAAGLFPTAAEEWLISRRFGQPRAEQLLYTLGEATGQALHEQHWSCPIVAAADVEACAQKLAGHLAGKSGRSLRLLKRHLAGPMVALSEALGACTPSPAEVGEGVNRHADGLVQVLRLHAPAHTQPADGRPLVAELCAALARLNDAVKTGALDARAIVLVSEHPQFLPGLNGDVHAVRQARQALLESALPIVAVLGGEDGSEVSGAAWLIAQCCDSVLHLRDGRYSAAGLLQDPTLANAACALFTQRLGLQMGKEILLSGAAYRGGELQQRAGLPVVADLQEGQARALAQAQAWAAFPAQTLQAWKQRRCQSHQEALQAADWPASAATDLPTEAEADTAEPMVLESTVIRATRHPHGIVVVRMEERAQKNLFSEAFIRGMREVLGRIQQCGACKVVILTGFDKYFASGGTREALLAIQQGKARFTDDSTYLWALQCPVPVIAALQGHAVGGGLSVGLFADFVLLSQESQCVSPYMNYGFTPGAGATLIVPERLGQDLGRESLLTGLEYAGSELAARGVALPVMPRKAIEPAAMALARALARHTREGLVALKHRFNRDIQHRLAQNTQQELAMHEQTFVGQAQTLQQIHSSFSPAPTVSNPQGAEPLAQIAATLLALLAQELQMSEADIDHDTPFIDLGLDSITGVTWMRKVNERYGTSLEATTVYSHPTLNKLARHVRAEAGAQAGDAPAALPPVVQAVQPATPDRARRTVALEPVQPLRGVDVQEVAAELRRMLAQELHLPESELDEDTQFIDLGMDSITGVTWVRKVNERYLTAFEATVVYSHPTLNKFSRHLSDVAAPARSGTAPALASAAPAAREPAFRELVSWRGSRRQPEVLAQPPAATAPAPAPVPPGPAAPRGQSIAVIGMAGQFAGARSLAEYWHNIAQGRHCIREIPRDRWDVDAYYQPGEPAAGKTNCRWMGLLDDIDCFDPLFFNILPAEARSMDPQQRLFLQTCWQGIEDAGYDAKALSGSRCGVFVGSAAGDYTWLSEKVQLSAPGFTGGASAILAARIAYFLNLQGPCLAIDTACSSSLVAIATACDSLVSGGSDLALAGGVYVGVGPAMHIMTSQAGMLSQDGHCYSFDHRANGFVPGEGVGVVLLKRLEDAERDGDIIQGVIQGWGVNQDGRTNGITAPNPDSQARLQQQVYDRYGIDPAGIQLIEAHGTGTVLGDPIEVQGLKKSFANYTTKKQFCAIGSVKSNIGHCLLAAGISGFLKLLLALRHRQLPPTINFDRLNGHIRLEDSPFYVNTRLQDWAGDDAGQRRAAISSFGYSGTNAHIVVGEHSPRTGRGLVMPLIPGAATLVPLSARTPGQLEQRCRDLLDFIRGDGRSADLLELAYTLQVGRQAMEERLVLQVESLADLAAKLQAVLDREPAVAGTCRGQVRANKEGLSLISQDEELLGLIVDRWIAQAKLSKLAALWAKGVEIDFRKLYGEAKPRRMVLPGYPFAKERYWIDDEDIDTSRLVNAWRVPHRRGAGTAAESHPAASAAREAKDDGLWLRGQWVPRALEAGQGTWLDRVRAVSGDDILVISGERETCVAIEQLCRGVEAITGHPDELWRVAHAPIEVGADGKLQALALAPLLGSGSGRLAVFLFLPNRLPESAPAGDLDIAFQCVEALTTSGADRPTQLYCCYRARDGEASVYQESLRGVFRSAMFQRAAHRYRCICVAAEPAAAGTLPLLAMREWLCDSTRGGPADDVPMVRYMNGERLELQLWSPTTASPESGAPAADGDGDCDDLVAAAAEAKLGTHLAAFEHGTLSREGFSDCLRGLEIERLSERMQTRIVQAIERVERGGSHPVAAAVCRPPAGAAGERILASVEKVLGLKADVIDFDRPLQEYGMDSITTVRLSAALEKEFGYAIAPSALVEHPSLNALTAKVRRDLGEMQLVS